MKSPYWSVKEVAAYIGISIKWVYKKKEKLPGYTYIHGLHKFHTDTFIEGLKRLSKRPPKDYGKGDNPHSL